MSSAMRRRVFDVLTQRLAKNDYTPQGPRQWSEVLPEMIGDAAAEIEALIVAEMAVLAERVQRLESIYAAQAEETGDDPGDESRLTWWLDTGAGWREMIRGADAFLPLDPERRAKLMARGIPDSNAAPHDFCGDCYRGDCAEHRGER